MVGSLFLTMALAWLTSCDGTKSPEPAAEAVYMVGNDTVPTNPAVDVCEPDDEMCGGEPTQAPAKPKRFVTVEFRVLHTPSKLVGNIGNDIFLDSNQVQTFLRTVHNDPHAEILASPRMILCSGQEGTISIGSCAPKGAACETPLPIGQKVANWPGIPNGEEFGVEPRVKKTGSLDGLTLKAMPRVSADGRYVEVILEGTTSFCPSGQCAGANQVSTARLHGCCPDGNTIFLRNGCCPPQPCTGVPVLTGLPIIGELFRVNGEEPENVVMMATVHVVDQAGQPVAQTSCTRDCHSCTCPNSQLPATVESNLEHLQRAKELYDLALLYERLNQVDVANKILCNILELCPHSRIALQAQSEYLRRQSIWFTDEPIPLGVPIISAVSGACNLPTCPESGGHGAKVTARPALQTATATGRTQKTNGGEESEAGAHSSKLDRILTGYRQACDEGNVDRARQLAIEALAIDPTCFAK
ncbi:MAG TPA: hypothetical protein VGP68_18025 [Gemmataceae bacterium]|jgi:hypothetical protein|nr:hypothetical protein [Gemmataceae bacterium]